MTICFFSGNSGVHDWKAAHLPHRAEMSVEVCEDVATETTTKTEGTQHNKWDFNATNIREWPTFRNLWLIHYRMLRLGY